MVHQRHGGGCIDPKICFEIEGRIELIRIQRVDRQDIRAGQQLRRLEVSNRKVTQQEQVVNQFGRVHDVVIGPDGLLYITLQLPGQSVSQSTPGMIARLVPVAQ